jgi:hypothetical protein
MLIEKFENEIRARDSGFAGVSMDYTDIKSRYFNTGCCCFNDGILPD